jgi:hypothetical protein
MNSLGNSLKLPGYGQTGHKRQVNMYTTYLNKDDNPIEHYGDFKPQLHQEGINQTEPSRDFLIRSSGLLPGMTVIQFWVR